MTPTQLDLARQLAALPGFRWGAGMRNVYPGDDGRWWTHTGGPDRINLSPWYGHGANHDPAEGLPDLTDDATGGVLLGWLAAMDQWPNIEHIAGGWSIAHGRTGHTYPGDTLAEACARALVAVGRCA